MRSDVFVLGLCAIEAGVLVQMGGKNAMRYDATRIALYIQRIGNMYGEELSNLLTQMT